MLIVTRGNYPWFQIPLLKGGSIQFFRVNTCPKFEHKLHRRKRRFGKIDTTVVLDKDENLL